MRPPTIGRNPLEFFFMAVKRPLKKMGMISAGQTPFSSKLIKAVSAVTNAGPDSLLLIRSVKCLASGYLDLPRDPAGKARLAFIMSASSTEIDRMLNGWRTFCLSGGGSGCLACSSLKVLSLTAAGLSSEQRILTAALVLPSSNLEAIASPKSVDESLSLSRDAWSPTTVRMSS